MVLDVITSSSFAPAAEVLSQTIEAIIEAVIDAKNVSIEKQMFAEVASYLNRIVPLLKELNQKDISDTENNFIEILNRQVKVAKKLTMECSKKNRVYLLMNCRSITKQLEDITREISRALSLIPLSSLNVSSSIIEEIDLLCESMRSVEFKTAIAEEEILEKIESGIQERNVDRSYANKLLLSIAETVGISTERSALKKEFEEFKSEIENAQLRKDQAEAIQLGQIIALLERADATSSREEKERKYLNKRNSLGSQLLEPLQSFYCPITREVMVDPVETSSGHTFERSAIEKWLADGNNACPITSIPLETSMLWPNNTLRQSIEEWKDRNTMITIASMRSKLSKPSSDNEVVVSCLEQLQDLCEQRDLHREWIVLENYIPIIVELLRARNQDIRNRALAILCILAKDSDDAKDRIAKVDNVIESIVRSLGRRVGERKLAVALLLELSRSETVRDCIGKVQGCILLLVTMSNSDDDNQAATYARELLENLSYSDQNVILMARANYFRHLLQRLSSGPEDVKMIMAATLAEMELTDHNKSSLFEGGALDSLLQLVSHGDFRMKEIAAKALHNLSSLPTNGWKMIRQGSVGPLLKLLYHHTSSQSLQEEVAAIIMHLAISTVSQNSSETPMSLLESDAGSLFSFINFTGPTVQQSLLRAFHAMCQSPSSTTVKAKLKQSLENLQTMVLLCGDDNPKVRANAVKLFCCLTEDDDKAAILELVNQKSIETLIRIIQSSNDEEEIASAMGVISNLPESPQLTEWLLESGGLLVISSHLHSRQHNGPHKNCVIENAVGSLCHFTAPTNQQSQKKAAEAGIIPVLVQLLELGTSLTKRRASVSLAQFSKSSFELTRPIPKPLGLFWCFSPPPEAGCSAHQGVCSVETSFCLVEANAVSPLVRLLGDPDLDACEASLDALLTLIEAERLQSGCKVLAEANAIGPIIKLLGSPSPRLQEKVLNSLERIFRLVEIKQKFGPSAQMPLVDLTQRGNSRTKSLAARILAQLNVLHEQSSYF